MRFTTTRFGLHFQANLFYRRVNKKDFDFLLLSLSKVNGTKEFIIGFTFSQ